MKPREKQKKKQQDFVKREFREVLLRYGGGMKGAVMFPCSSQFFVLRRRIFLRKDAAPAIQLSEAYVMERTISCSKSPNFFPNILKPPGYSASGLFPMRMVMGVLAEK